MYTHIKAIVRIAIVYVYTSKSIQIQWIHVVFDPHRLSCPCVPCRFCGRCIAAQAGELRGAARPKASKAQVRPVQFCKDGD